MENIPMKVPTKTLVFSDQTSVENDRITGETPIIAFRAFNCDNGDKSYDMDHPGN